MTIVHDRIGISIPELAVRFGISEAVLYRQAGAGQLRGCRRVGHRFIVHLPTFEAWVMAGVGDELGGADEK